MRRLALVGLMILAIGIGAVVVIPHGNKGDARSILVGVAQAIENADSVYAVTRVTEQARNTATGLRLMPGQAESWLGKKAAYTRYVLPNGRVTMATAMNLETGKVWCYRSSKNVKYEMNVMPLSPKASGLVGRITQMIRETAFLGYFKQVLGNRLRNVQQSVRQETRDGRKLTIVTLTGTLRSSPRRVTDRWVFIIDTQTNHLLYMRRYAKATGRQPVLVATIDKVEYNTPLPDELANPKIPNDVKVVQATASVKEADNILKLMMKTDDGEVLRSTVPLPRQ